MDQERATVYRVQPEPKKLGDLLEERMRAVGLNQTQVSEALYGSSSRQTDVSTWLLNKKLPPRDIIAKLATLLGMDYRELLLAREEQYDRNRTRHRDYAALPEPIVGLPEAWEAPLREMVKRFTTPEEALRAFIEDVIAADPEPEKARAALAASEADIRETEARVQTCQKRNA